MSGRRLARRWPAVGRRERSGRPRECGAHCRRRPWFGRRVGLTGKTVAPNLCITLGISGAISHIAGCSNAKATLAINSHADAAMFKVARIGVVGDYPEGIPALVEELSKRRRTLLSG